MITIENLLHAENYTIFRGKPERVELEPNEWDLFAVSGYSELGKEVLHELHDRGIQLVGDALYFSPMVDDEATHDREPRVDDFHAAMAYLGEGGAVVKVPDTLKSPYSRYYAVARAKGQDDMGKKDLFDNGPSISQMDRMLKGTDMRDRELRERVLRSFGDEKAHFVNEREFDERFMALRRLLPPLLAEEPLVLAAYLDKMLLNPGMDGFVLVEAWKLRFEGKK